MTTVKLISEEVQDVEYITEEKENGKKDYKIKGIFMQADIKNRNGRVYPMEILQKEVKRYNKQYINEKRAFGELGHPDGPTVNLERASHMITGLYPDGKNFIGEAKILSTPMGNIVKNLMDEGAKLGVSSRGMGSLDQKNGANYDAFVDGIMEGKEWIWDNGTLVESELIRMRERINTRVRKRQASEDALELASFLKML